MVARLPATPRVQACFRLPPELYAALVLRAAAEKRSLNELVRTLLEETTK